MRQTTIQYPVLQTFKAPNISETYGPYTSLQEAHDTLADDRLCVVGLTVGIKDNLTNTIREFWYQGGTDISNLVEKNTLLEIQIVNTWTIGADGYWYLNGSLYTDENHPNGILAEGHNGTGIELKGSVDYVLNNELPNPNPDNKTSLLGLNSNNLNYGDCYMVKSNGWLYFYDGTTSAANGTNGVPDNPNGWVPVGEIKGEAGIPGTTYYYHIAWADEIIFDINLTPISQQGFSVIKNKEDYKWMGICIDTNQYDPGSAQRPDPDSYKLYKWNNNEGPMGPQGIPGDSPIYAYRWYKEGQTVSSPSDVSSDEPSATQNSNANPTDHWAKYPPTQNSEGWNLWMITSTKHKDAQGNYSRDNWSTPVCISGDKGDPGADAIEREWIYRLNDNTGYTSTTGTASGVNISGKNDQDVYRCFVTKDFVPEGWSDNPSGVSSYGDTEYASYRDFNKAANIWELFHTPIIWSHYGEKGMDGDGVLYIFKTFDHELTDGECTLNTPTRINITQNSAGEWIPNGWSDEPNGTDVDHQFEYVSIIKSINGTWGDFSKISLWSKYSVDGDRGDFLSRVFARTDSDISATRPTGGDYDHPYPGGVNGTTQNGATWYDGVPSGTATLWTSSRTFKGDGTATLWSLPTIESDTADLDIEFSPSELQPAIDTLRTTPGGAHPGNTGGVKIWYDPNDNDFGSAGTMIWRAERKIKGNSYEGAWVITRIYGEQGEPASITINSNGYWVINGVVSNVQAEGKDGTGVNVKGSVALSTDLTVENNLGYAVPVGGTKTLVSDGDCYVCDGDRHLYMWLTSVHQWQDLGEFKGEAGKNSYIHIAYATANPLSITTSTVNSIGFTVVNNGNSYDWWGFYADEYPNDPGYNWNSLSNSEKVTVVNTYKWNYMKGKDGSGVEYVYLLTKEGVTPTISSSSYVGTYGDPTQAEFLPKVANFNSSNMLSDTWTDDPAQGVSSTWPVLWWAKRTYYDDSWHNFGTPKIHNRYAWDGATYKYVYRWYLNATSAPTPYPTFNNTNTEITSMNNWENTPSNRPQGNGYFLWMISCRVDKGVYSAWGNPVRLTGDTGSPGEDAQENEWIYKRSDANPGTPLSSGSGTVNGVTTPYGNTVFDWVPNGWTDNPQGVDINNKTEWATWREYNKATETWGGFNTPFIWSHYGERGIDGDGVEYVFVRTKNNTPPSFYGYKTVNPNNADSYGKLATEDDVLPLVTISSGSAGDIIGNTHYNQNGYNGKVAECTDDPQGVTSTYKYEWVFKRTKSAPNQTTGVRTWNAYSGSMSLWSNWANSVSKVTPDTYRYAVSASGSTTPSQNGSPTGDAVVARWYTDRSRVVSLWSMSNPYLWVETTIHWNTGDTVLYTTERYPNDGVPGQDIIVNDTYSVYALSDDNTEIPSSWSNYGDIASLLTDRTVEKWLWCKTTTTYKKASDNTSAGSSDNYTVSYLGTNGKPGAAISSITEHYNVSNSSTTTWNIPPNGDYNNEWTTNPNVPDSNNNNESKWNAENPYLWNYEVIHYSESGQITTKQRTTPRIIAIWTDNGKGVDTVVNKYAINNSGTTPPPVNQTGANGWDDDAMAPTVDNQYLWNYETVHWTDNTSTGGYDTAHVIGHYGKDADDYRIVFSFDDTAGRGEVINVIPCDSDYSLSLPNTEHLYFFLQKKVNDVWVNCNDYWWACRLIGDDASIVQNGANEGYVNGNKTDTHGFISYDAINNADIRKYEVAFYKTRYTGALNTHLTSNGLVYYSYIEKLPRGDDAVTYYIKTDLDYLRVASNADLTTDITTYAHCYKKIANLTELSYATKWLLYYRKDNVYVKDLSDPTKLMLNGWGASSNNQSSVYADIQIVQNPIRFSMCDTLVLFALDSVPSNYQTEIPTSYLVKKEIPIIKDGDTVTANVTSTYNANDTTTPVTGAAVAAAVSSAVSSALSSVLTYKGTIGNSSATVTSLPATHQVGWVYVVATAGTYAGKACEIGDYIICKTAGTTALNSHWDVINGENQVSNNNATLAWNSPSTIATVDGTNITVTMPDYPSKADVGLGNVGNFKAVSTVASQGLSDTEKTNARSNIGAGTVTSVSVGAGLKLNSGGSISTSGTISPNLKSTSSLGTIGTTSKLYPIGLDNGNQLCVNVPWTDTNTTYSNATTTAAGLMSAADKTKVDHVSIDGSDNIAMFSDSNITLGCSGSILLNPYTKAYYGSSSAGNEIVKKSDILLSSSDLSFTKTSSSIRIQNASSLYPILNLSAYGEVRLSSLARPTISYNGQPNGSDYSAIATLGEISDKVSDLGYTNDGSNIIIATDGTDTDAGVTILGTDFVEITARTGGQGVFIGKSPSGGLAEVYLGGNTVEANKVASKGYVDSAIANSTNTVITTMTIVGNVNASTNKVYFKSDGPLSGYTDNAGRLTFSDPLADSNLTELVNSNSTSGLYIHIGYAFVVTTAGTISTPEGGVSLNVGDIILFKNDYPNETTDSTFKWYKI